MVTPKKGTKTKFITATFGEKLSAFFIDAIIICLTIVPLSFILLQKWFSVEKYPELMILLEQNQQLKAWFMVYLTIVAILIMIYFVIYEYRMGRTPGKQVMKLRVVSTRYNSMTIIDALIRNLTALIIVPTSAVMFLFLVIEILSQIDNPLKQRLFERLSQTRVIKEVTK